MRCPGIVVLFLLLASFGLASGTGAVDTATPDDTAEQSAENPDPTRITKELADRLVGELVSEVEKIRGLEFDRPVSVEVIDDEGAREHVIRRLDLLHPEGFLEATSEAYVLLGLLPPKSDILASLLDVLREEAGGFYDPDSKVYYLLEDMPAILAPMIMVHELIHALEDQHYDLDARLREVIHDDDRVFACSAVHEGSASILMTVFVGQRLLGGEIDAEQGAAYVQAESGRADALQKLPPVLLRQLLGTYILGTAFLAGGDMLSLVGGGYPGERVDRAYADGPVSSEQILHPEKYWDPAQRDLPIEVDLHDAGSRLGRGWRRSVQGVLGELTLAVMVGGTTPLDPEQLLSDPGASWTHPAAAGWGGDRWELWKHGNAAAVLLKTVWDSPEDAQEFAEALPRDAGLRWRRQAHEVAVVAGLDKEKKIDRVLSGILAKGD
jgi:hypothetical protein